MNRERPEAKTGSPYASGNAGMLNSLVDEPALRELVLDACPEWM
jgi:hypothetical protein